MWASPATDRHSGPHHLGAAFHRGHPAGDCRFSAYCGINMMTILVNGLSD